ncbi:heme exporter protein CcmD [Enterobacteriaceae bacterium 89]|nr:heme exporter protein CcmD [Enterobacteriaceae bacterium 89]
MTSAFANWQDFWAMGGYAFYVWLAVAGTLLPLLGLLGHCILQRRAVLHQIAQQQTRQRRRQAVQQKQEAL